ncbi:MAG: hypothetical protein ACAF41_07575 [Leptolyngbya sp. BL-A-14]
MVASPEVCRMNGAKSKGAVTERGKAIASRNALKHGIMSSHPPLLATEDLETFQGMMQGLMDEYQPQVPTEHLLVQQVAMAWLRLHRLWGVEAAQANKALLFAQIKAKYPDLEEKRSLSFNSKTWQESRQEERNMFLNLLEDLTFDLSRLPSQPAQYRKWITQVDESLYTARSASIKARNDTYEHLSQGFWLVWDQLHWLIYDRDDDEGNFRKKPSEPDVMRAAIQAVMAAAQTEVDRISRELAEFKQHHEAIALADAASKGLQNPELFSRYERHITQQLNEAIGRLTEMQQRRQQRDSMGSFGQDPEISARIEAMFSQKV